MIGRNNRWHACATKIRLSRRKINDFLMGGLILPGGGRVGPNQVGFRRQGLELLRRHYSFSLEDGIEFISRQVLDRVERARGPANFQAVDLDRRSESEMHAQIVLRKITAATVDLRSLGHATRDHL